MIIVDSSVWIDYFNGKRTLQTDWLDSSLSNTPILMGGSESIRVNSLIKKVVSTGMRFMHEGPF